MSGNTALFTGRFQPPSIGHVAMVDAILERWHRLIIGVVDPNLHSTDSFDQRWLPHMAVTKNGFSPQNFIFSPHEIVRMWRAWIEDEGLKDRVTAKPVPRIFLNAFSELYPGENYDLVYPAVLPDDSHAEHLRQRIFPELLRRAVYHVEPRFQLHNSQIKKLVQEGRNWKEFIPRGAYEVFKSIDGALRVTDATHTS
jgi:nicotinamide mononucleotide adenylyltransferase